VNRNILTLLLFMAVVIAVIGGFVFVWLNLNTGVSL